MILAEYPLISIVTPNYNQEKYLELTIQSLLSQNYPNLEYIIIDGGSTDGSVEIIKKYEHQIKYWVSEKDNGLYHALSKGFNSATGEIMGWLNSDDLLLEKSLFKIAEVFRNNQNVEWVEAKNTTIDLNGAITVQCTPPIRNYRKYLSKVAFDNMNFCFIQQESTYWRRSLWNKAGAAISVDYKLAGDFELWMRFFKTAHLFHLNTTIGAFRNRGSEQLSVGNYALYIQEAFDIIKLHVKECSFLEQAEIGSIILLNKLFKIIPIIGIRLQNRFSKKLFTQKVLEL